MQLVTAQLSERVEHLMDIQELQTALASAEAKPAEMAKATTEPSLVLTSRTRSTIRLRSRSAKPRCS